MAYSKTPENNTYQTKFISLMRDYNSRNQRVNEDVDALNCFYDINKNKTLEQNEFTVTKRAGTNNFGTSFVSTDMRALYFWEDQNKLFVAVNNDIRVISSVDGSTITTLNNVFSTTTGDVGFAEFLYDNNTVKLVATDGTTLITIDTANTVVTCTDPDMPAHLPQPIFLDGYLFVIKTNTADIYNSDLNDPLLWTPGNFISCEMFADKVLRIAKLNNYIVCFGSSSVEYFWDAANATGSPLQRNDTPVKLHGFLGGFAQAGNKIYFMGQTSVGTPTIYELEDFKIEDRGTPSLRRYLEVLDAPIETIYGSVVSFLGHDFYVLNVQTAFTYCMDLETKLWTRLAYRDTLTFDIIAAVNVKIDTEYASVFLLGSTPAVLRFNREIYTDGGTNFTMRVVSDRQMFDTLNQKRMNRLSVNADRVSSSIDLSWSDDDYQTYSTPVSIPLNQDLPSIHRLGSFRRRAFKLEFTADSPLRVKNFEVEINMGQW